MEQSRRDKLRHLQRQPTTHAGLWMDKFLVKQMRREEKLAANEKNPLAQLVEEVATLKPPADDDTYAEFFQRWQDTLKQIDAVSKRASVQGRLSVGLGAEGVLETAVTLHHTYGVPYIPGSALKGLAASYARKRLPMESWGPQPKNQENGAYEILFGDTESAGYVIFFDALYVPGSGHLGQALYPDVITVHHPDYYQGDRPPADWDNPTPVPFLSATGKYLLALVGDPQWVDAAYEILNLALREEGIGAKTSSGYGRMTIEGFEHSPGIWTSAGAKPGLQFQQPVADLPRHQGRGKVRYEGGRPIIVDEPDPQHRLKVDWKALGMESMKEKTVVDYEYEESSDGRRRVVKITKTKL